jgi:hypothetical protein
MFAGLPGIGVGSLFYVLAALWMPVHEMGRVVRGTSSLARWRRIAIQWVYALSIVVSIALADRVMLWLLGAAQPGSFSPARLLHGELGARAPHSILAAPMTASFLLLGAVLLVVEAFRLRQQFLLSRRSSPLNVVVEPSALNRTDASFLGET